VRDSRIIPLTVVKGRAGGAMEGIGHWYFFAYGDINVIRYGWLVGADRLWMNVIAPLARPLFKWNHDQVMRQGAEGMACFFGVRPPSPAHG